MVSTRADVRPFTPEEQRRILRVGACLTCHPGDSPVMRESVRDFGALLARRRAVCLQPAWESTPNHSEVPAGFCARMKPLKNRPSTSGAMASTSKPCPDRNSRASSTL